MNENNSVEIDFSSDSTNLYIFFGGISASIGMPPFEFYNSAKIINENKIFFRDFSQSWYQNGIKGISKDIYSTATYIRGQIENLKPKKIFFVGNSMGGYGAILFNELISEGETRAFAPQTFISPVLRLIHKDSRWKEQILNTYKSGLIKRHIWDIKPILLRERKNRKISVFVSSDDRLDFIHASRIKNIKGVYVYEYENGGHNLVKLLRDKGELSSIMLGKV